MGCQQKLSLVVGLMPMVEYFMECSSNFLTDRSKVVHLVDPFCCLRFVFFFFFFFFFFCYTVLSIPCSLNVNCWERTDFLALLCFLFTLCFVTFPYGARVSCGAFTFIFEMVLQ